MNDSSLPGPASRDADVQFVSNPVAYAQARVGYAAELFDSLVRGGYRVLDVGCGTGISSREFLARGCTVTGLEPDAGMARIAREAGIPVIESSVENWVPVAREFDIVSFGQSWHWVDSQSALLAASRALVRGGQLALYWNYVIHTPDVLQAIVDATHEAAVRLRRSPAETPPDRSAPREVLHAAGSIAASPDFARPGVECWTNSVEFSASQWVHFMATISDYAALPAADARRLLNCVQAKLEAVSPHFSVDVVTHLVRSTRL